MAKDKVEKQQEAVVEKKDVVEVPRATLEKLIGQVEKLEKEQAILREAADQKSLKRVADLRAEGKLVKNVNLSSIGGKIVSGWSKVKDDVYFDEQGRLHEEQSIRVFFFGEDGTKDMDYRAFSRTKTPVVGEVIQETRDKDGNTNMKILLADGREIDIDVKFVN